MNGLIRTPGGRRSAQGGGTAPGEKQYPSSADVPSSLAGRWGGDEFVLLASTECEPALRTVITDAFADPGDRRGRCMEPVVQLWLRDCDGPVDPDELIRSRGHCDVCREVPVLRRNRATRRTETGASRTANLTRVSATPRFDLPMLETKTSRSSLPSTMADCYWVTANRAASTTTTRARTVRSAGPTKCSGFPRQARRLCTHGR